MVERKMVAEDKRGASLDEAPVPPKPVDDAEVAIPLPHETGDENAQPG